MNSARIEKSIQYEDMLIYTYSLTELTISYEGFSFKCPDERFGKSGEMTFTETTYTCIHNTRT